MASLFAGMVVPTPLLVISTFLKHYTQKKKITADNKAKEELLYDEAFNVIKLFLGKACDYPVEQLQVFCNTHIPAPPSVSSIRVLIPPRCCDEAAEILIKAFGGEEKMKAFTGGTRWWQVRGIAGVDANWVWNRKDGIAADRHRRQSTASKGESSSGDATPQAGYTADWDPLTCMLYFHGGGYFFGSTDLERFCVNRFSRKIKGRVFSVNYRLAPQYPFPCQIQDAIAAYLYLLNPPPGALHKPINPRQIVLNGDSAGGGLVLALLQVIRDTGLPMPAGAVLVSPWVDLTHSFPSAMQNTDSDIIPRYGLGRYKPGAAWPPPSDEVANQVREHLTSTFRAEVDKAKGKSATGEKPSGLGHSASIDKTGIKTVLGDTKMQEFVNVTAPPAGKEIEEYGWGKKKPVHGVDFYPIPTERGATITGDLDGHHVEMSSQIQLYAQNHQLSHPLVSPVNAYLGGLCPLYVLVGDKECVRDEGIYIAHKAAHPEKYPLKPEIVELYAPLKDIEKKYGPTQVHLQNFDSVCHIITFFTFTTPSIYSYRAIARFCDLVAPDSKKGKLPDQLKPNAINSGPGYAGNADVYKAGLPFKDNMIRERVSVKGELRDLEPESDLVACNWPAEMTCAVVLAAARRYLEGQAKWDKKYAKTAVAVDKERQKHIAAVQKDTEKQIQAINSRLSSGKKASGGASKANGGGAPASEAGAGEANQEALTTENGLHTYLNNPAFSWAWAIEGENPPPSSLVARRDIAEARKLASSADVHLEQRDQPLAGSNLWATTVQVLEKAEGLGKKDSN